jgi:hypothetical protein
MMIEGWGIEEGRRRVWVTVNEDSFNILTASDLTFPFLVETSAYFAVPSLIKKETMITTLSLNTYSELKSVCPRITRQ